MWSPWSQVTDCMPACGPGTQTRQRQRPCVNRPGVTQFDVQTFACQTDPVDGRGGEWSEWAVTSNCQAYCGRGLAKAERSRECTNPAPSCGGRRCSKAELVGKSYKPCENFACGPICPADFKEYVSQYSPAQGFYIQCRKKSGYIRRCPTGLGDDWLDLRSSSMLGFNDVYSVCSGNYRYG
ncbi:thrombospondin-2 [Elysia marginata]|uniref:Thrombospondin-2 n=1 Tax=Elysia marginata TaxID=1093978 RepID=A0AAV4FTG4_9GAST|nr:thrombospondin-2 [Elysia marginata]